MNCREHDNVAYFNINYKVDNLKMKTKYEFKLCSFYENLISSWTEIKQIETILDIDSAILNKSKKTKEFINQIKIWLGNKQFDLLYRGTRDGSSSSKFHEKCDNQGPTMTLHKNDKGNIFGGYSCISWKNSGDYQKGADCFLFSLDNIHNTEPCKFPIKSENEGVYHNISYGPSFGNGCDITIYDDFKNKKSYSDFPCRYKDILGKGRSIFTGDNNSNNNMKIEEIEVFKII